mgnify:CR=1 FL=1
MKYSRICIYLIFVAVAIESVFCCSASAKTVAGNKVNGTLPESGRELYRMSCAACHGTGGRSPGAIPSINGKSSDLLFQALTEFQNGSRPSTVMGRHAKGYSRHELRLIAEFFSQQ